MNLTETPLIRVAIILGIVLLGSMIVHWLFARTVRRLVSTRYISEPSAGRLRVAVRWGVYPFALFVALQATGIMSEAWALLSAIVAALAVGFVAVWSVLSNVTSALVVLTFRPFRVGDVIEIMDGDKAVSSGKVLDLNLFYTSLEHSGAVTRVPNNFFVQKVIRVVQTGRAEELGEASRPFFSSAPE